MADKMADNRLTALTAKNHQEYICECCNYKTLRLSEFNRHKNTAKHRRSEKITKITENEENKKWICECGKSYKQRQSLHKHKKKCLFQEKMEETLENQEIKKKDSNYEKGLSDETVIAILKENIEMRKTMVEQATEHRKQINELMPLIGNTTNNNNFNLNLFLNDTCKDALNLTDFINSLQVQLKDLEFTTDNGHVKGITNIFHNALSNLEVERRPLHCTDLKREVLYIKDNDAWHKDEERGEIKKAVNKVVNKNISNASEWLNKYPEHNIAGSKDFENYVKMTENSLGTGEDDEQNKIVKNIMKTVTIEKKIQNS
jgi:hypothetical protein